MRTYIRTQLVNGANTVVEIISTDEDINDLYHKDFVALLIDVTDVEPKPEVWWTYDGEVFSPPA